MSRSPSPDSPFSILGNTANTLLQQYNSQSITLEQLKDAVNAQIVPFMEGLDTSSHNDDAMHNISNAVAMVNAVE